MVRRFYDLPAMNTLSVFEASARHASFTRAASELNVTPGAVSRQIRTLEDDLGVPLFVRNGKGVVLTAPGEELHQVLAHGFSRASDVVRSIRRGDKSRNVTLACTDAFATMWLIPRMPDFWATFPEVIVDHLISEDSRIYRSAEVELRIRYGHGTWVGESAELLFDDWIYPVCSPRFARDHAGITRADLPSLPLLDMDWSDPGWLNWDDALLRGGIAHGVLEGRRFGKFSVALQAALADQGLVLGWHRHVREMVEKGTLVRMTDLLIQAPGSYYLTWNGDRALSAAAVTFRDWIRGHALIERDKSCYCNSAKMP